MDSLVDAVYERFKDRFFEDESQCYLELPTRLFLTFFFDPEVIVELKESKEEKLVFHCLPQATCNMIRYWARVLTVRMPAQVSDEEPHRIRGPLRVEDERMRSDNDPSSYVYRVQVLEEVSNSSSAHSASKGIAEKSSSMKNKIIEVRCLQMRWAIL